MRLTVFIAAAVMSLSACASRIVDPTDPVFNRQEFRYSDYRSFKQNRYESFKKKSPGVSFGGSPVGYQMCMAYFPKLLPQGLTKVEVDRVLKEAIATPKENAVVQYTHIDKRMWLHTITDVFVQYGPDMQVQSVTCRDGYKGL